VTNGSDKDIQIEKLNELFEKIRALKRRTCKHGPEPLRETQIFMAKNIHTCVYCGSVACEWIEGKDMTFEEIRDMLNAEGVQEQLEPPCRGRSSSICSFCKHYEYSDMCSDQARYGTCNPCGKMRKYGKCDFCE